MNYNVFTFKSLKIVLGQSDTSNFIGYVRDTKYPEFNRVFRGSVKEVIEVCIYLYKARLLTAYNCEKYTVFLENYREEQLVIAAHDWVDYVLNRYLCVPLGYTFEYTYSEVEYIWPDGHVSMEESTEPDGILVQEFNPVPRKRVFSNRNHVI